MRYIILTLLLFSISDLVHSIQFAQIKSEKAIVYADQSMLSAIGYIKRGRKIKIGEIPRRYGTIFPVAISGKVAYIKIKDITIIEVNKAAQAQMTSLEHIIIDEAPEDIMADNNYLTLINNVFVPGKEWEQTSSQLNDDVGERPTYISLMFEHRIPENRYSFGVGISYFAQKQESIVAKAMILDIHLYLSPLNFKYATLDLIAGIMISGDFRLEGRYNTDEEDEQGEMVGSKLGLQFRYFPHSIFSVVNGLTFHNMHISNTSYTKMSLESGDKKEIKKIKGTNYYLGISYKF